jgi:hypothetical protein
VGNLLGEAPRAGEYTLDKRGWSPQAARELGADFLERSGVRRVILLSHEQAHAGLVDPPASYYDGLLADAFGLKAVDRLLAAAPLVGEVKADRPGGRWPPIRGVITLDTAGHDLAGLASARPEQASTTVEHGMRARSERAGAELPAALARALGGRSPIVIRGPLQACRPIGSSWDSEQPGVTVLVWNPTLAAEPPPCDADAICVRADSPDLVRLLVEGGFALVDPGLVDERLQSMEDAVLVGTGVDPRHEEAQRRRTEILARSPFLPEVYHELRDLARLPPGERPREIERLSPAARLKLLRPQREQAVVGRLLAEMDETDPVALWRHHPERLAAHVRSCPPLAADWLLWRVEQHLCQSGQTPAGTPGAEP